MLRKCKKITIALAAKFNWIPNMGMTKASLEKQHSLSPSGRGRVRAAKIRAGQYLLTLALSLFITGPVQAEMVLLTATNNNGDRDTTRPGLQVDEGDQVTFRIEITERTIPTYQTEFSLTGQAADLSPIIRATPCGNFPII